MKKSFGTQKHTSNQVRGKTSKFGDAVLYPYYNDTIAPHNALMKLVESHAGGIQPARSHMTLP